MLLSPLPYQAVHSLRTARCEGAQGMSRSQLSPPNFARIPPPSQDCGSGDPCQRARPSFFPFLPVFTSGSFRNVTAATCLLDRPAEVVYPAVGEGPDRGSSGGRCSFSSLQAVEKEEFAFGKMPPPPMFPPPVFMQGSVHLPCTHLLASGSM